jgi:hypothetical protein
MSIINLGGGGTADSILTTLTIASLGNTSAPVGGLRYVIENDTIYSFDGSNWSAVAGGGGGAVDSVNGFTGVVVLDADDIGLGNVDNTSDANKPISTATQTALDDKQDVLIGVNNGILGLDNSGDPVTLPGLLVSIDTGGLSVSLEEPIEDLTSLAIHSFDSQMNPTENSPYSQRTHFNIVSRIDEDDDGFSFGTAGVAVRNLSMEIYHQGVSDTGSLDHITLNYNVGNGTDPIDVRGFGYVYGFGSINANANITGSIQGYGFQPSVNALATFDTNSWITAFYDAAQISAPLVEGYTSASYAPTIAEIGNNRNYTGLSVTPTVTAFTGNASINAVAISGTYGDMGPNSSWNGVNINPTISEARYAGGLVVNMDNVTLYPGAQSSLVFQDLTFEFIQPESISNFYTLEYTPGATAGSEVVSLVGNAIGVQIEDGVSTANQIKAAMEAIPDLNAGINITVSGVGSDPQNIAGPTNFTGGANPGSKQAAYLDGDVQITGSLSFGGALSIGQLNAFASQAVVDGGGNPSSIHTLITSPTVAANATIANADTLGVNTAALIQIGDNATVTSAFLGLTALGLPAVLNMGSGSTIDRVSAAAFALSLDTAATGGTVTDLELCRSIAIPNGSTTVTNLYGFKFDLPFGDPGTNTWGVYITPTSADNYFAKNVLVGTPTATNASVGIELNSTDKAVLLSRMDSTEEAALTATNGMIIYNDQTHKFRGYANGAWVDLH